jgi:predicted nucleic acid-binding protein
MGPPFLDTNILVRHFLQDHGELSPKATAIIDRIERDELTVRLSDIVVFETVFVLERAYKIPQESIASFVLRVLEFPKVLLPDKQQYRDVFALYTSPGRDFADCYHAVMMGRLGVDEVLSFDQDLDKLPGVSRREE